MLIKILGIALFFLFSLNVYVRDDLKSTSRTYTNNKVSDPSNAPYKFITYSDINSAGRQWIRKYTLALAKELLGIIRSKYASMPLPNGEVSLDGEALKAEGREEKAQALDELKEFLDSVSLTEKSRQEQDWNNSLNRTINNDSTRASFAKFSRSYFSSFSKFS